MPPLRQTHTSRPDGAAPRTLPVPARLRALARQLTMWTTVHISLQFNIAAALLPLAVCNIAHPAQAAPMRSVAIASTGDPYLPFVTEASQRFGVPPSWIGAVVHVESRGNVHAVSPKGAMGLMQIMPDTWAELRQRYHLGADPFDPHDNILAGTAYLRELYDRFGAAGFLAAYNAGARRYQDYVSGLRPLHDETKLYLAKLASLLPDVPIDRAVLVGAYASNWWRAALFTAPPASPPPSTIVRSGRPAAATSSAAVSALTPHSDGLFVPVTMADQQ